MVFVAQLAPKIVLAMCDRRGGPNKDEVIVNPYGLNGPGSPKRLTA
jgi:hypothetical protein